MIVRHRNIDISGTSATSIGNSQRMETVPLWE